MLWKCCTQYASIGKLSGHRRGKGQFSFQSQRKSVPKNVQVPSQLHSFHMLATYCSKFSKLGFFNSRWTVNFQMFMLDLEKAEEPEIKLPTSTGSLKKQVSSKKTSTSALLTMPNGEGNSNPLQYSCLENPMDEGAWWVTFHGVTKSRTQLSNFTFTFHFYALEKEMSTHSSILAWRIPGMEETGGLPSMGSHRVEHSWHNLAAAAAAKPLTCVDHNKLWKILKVMGIPDHLTCLLRNLYAGQEAMVRTGHGTTD